MRVLDYRPALVHPFGSLRLVKVLLALLFCLTVCGCRSLSNEWVPRAREARQFAKHLQGHLDEYNRLQVVSDGAIHWPSTDAMLNDLPDLDDERRRALLDEAKHWLISLPKDARDSRYLFIISSFVSANSPSELRGSIGNSAATDTCLKEPIIMVDSRQAVYVIHPEAFDETWEGLVEKVVGVCLRSEEPFLKVVGEGPNE